MNAAMLSVGSPILGVITSPAMWYVTRGAGIVATLLLTVSVVLGIATSFDVHTDRVPRFVTAALHRNVSLLALLLLVVHIVTVVVDGYAPVRWIDTVVPFISAYHGFALGIGVVASDILIAVAATSALRSKISYRSWRLVHWLAYACWPTAIWHGLLIGTDRTHTWLLALNGLCVLVVVAAMIARVLRRPRRIEGQLVGPKHDPLARLRTMTSGRSA